MNRRLVIVGVLLVCVGLSTWLVPHAATYADIVVPFSATNETTNNLGTVTINLTSGEQSYLVINGDGFFTINLDGPVASIVINGVVIPVNTDVNVILPNGKIVRIHWESPNVIVIVDQNEL